MDQLKMVEFKKALDLLSLMDSDVPQNQFERRTNSDKERDEKIKYFTTLIKTNQISVSEFLDAMSNKVILRNTGIEFAVYFCTIY